MVEYAFILPKLTYVVACRGAKYNIGYTQGPRAHQMTGLRNVLFTTRMQDATTVIIPRPNAKVIAPIVVVYSLRNRFVTCSPKRAITGARSVAKLLANRPKVSLVIGTMHCAVKLGS